MFFSKYSVIYLKIDLLFNQIWTKGSFHSSFVDAQVYNRTENNSISGYEVIEHTYPYSADYQTIDVYDMMSDFHSDTPPDSSQPDMHNFSIGNGRLEAVSTGDYEQPSNTGSQSLNINMIGANNHGKHSHQTIQSLYSGKPLCLVECLSGIAKIPVLRYYHSTNETKISQFAIALIALRGE